MVSEYMNLYEQMLNTAAGCGMNVISREHAAQLIAVVFLYGDESTVFSQKMNADIRYIQKRYGLMGGCAPDMGFVKLAGQYVRDIRQNGHPEWMKELEKRYDVTFPEWKEAPKEKPPWCTHT